MEYQLRDYQVKQGEMADWIEEWVQKVYPLRIKFGFQVIGAWTTGDDRFVWILGWDGPGNFENADRTYYASSERTMIDPNPARHLTNTKHSFMNSVLPSVSG